MQVFLIESFSFVFFNLIYSLIYRIKFVTYKGEKIKLHVICIRIHWLKLK